MSRKTWLIGAGVILASLVIIIILTAALTPSGAHPAFAAAEAFMAAAGRGDDAVAESYLSPAMQAYVAANCPDGSVSACIDAYTPPEWGGLIKAVYRRSTPEGNRAWDVDLIATYQFGTGFSGVCIYQRMEQDESGAWKVAGWAGFLHCGDPASRDMESNPDTPNRAPGETPAVLNPAPGAGVIVDGERYANDTFSAAIPAGWRVITSPADAPPAVTFAAPDNCAVIHLAPLPAAAPAAPNCDQPTRTITREVALDGVTIYAAGIAPISAWEAFLDSFERLLDSVR